MEKPLRIGIDCRLWNETGVGRYIRNIVKNLARIDSKNNYVVFVLNKDYDTIDLPFNFKKVKANIHWHTFAEQIIFPILCLRENLDVLHVMHFNFPVLYPKKTLVTIHDLTPIKIMTGRVTTLPYPFYFIKTLGLRLAIWMAVIKCKYIFTVSSYVKSDIVKTFNVDPNKIVLTPCALEEHFLNLPQKNVEEVLAKYKVTKPYIFYVGNAHPHKNLERLIEAFDIVSAHKPDLHLVLGGNKKFFYDRLEKESKNKKSYSKISFIGFVDDMDLPYLYKNAEAFINPSLSEGFGIQSLEAFACETKVVCSNTSSLPEIGDAVAYYFDPTNVDDIAQKIESALDDKDPSRKELGVARAHQFSWKDSAQTILNYYEE